MTTAALLVLAGLIGLGFGGEWLVRGSVGIAQRMGISNLVTGLVIVGAATSMPEMVASIQAAMIGSPGIAWGNIAGSNIANTLLILGAAALVAPIVLTGAGRRDAVVALAASVLIWLLTWQGIASPLLGMGLLVLLVVYIVWRYRHPRPDDEEEDEDPPILWKAILFFIIGVAALVVGGKLLVDGAVDIARFAGLSETVIGLTVVAIGTSLPELAASVAAALRGKSGLALGNVVGSNIYNLLLIGGVTMTIAPFPIPAELVDVELPLVVGSALMLLLLCWFANRINRWLGGALLLGFAAFNVMLLI
ncbi:calcium/sodium antiporter [Pontixanthobacter aestiaquae]|uniref:Calcium/sodium antiporter n=1 Tax=Pontixanthobacter aestiaquae TaxID=1509367 RepID=A0A844Z7M0_9SPHN|nr:calcium/sodium antiporter [Pontixanthobacter aestiaquae]MDN3645930.1 calcium/sodium antiporter [Pontixanthobacter aestiaquae]MXO83077.1 calcium/sodium antiporter [Pontixanthobacter aestiaquae]